MQSKQEEIGRHPACTGPRRALSPLRVPGSALRRAVFLLASSILGMLLLPGAVHAADLRIASWNLEHLNDTDGKGCLPRKRADYAAIARQVRRLGADIVAFQEVENAAAARRVFPRAQWRVEISSRPFTRSARPCRHRPDQRLGHLATGFALRHGVDYRRHRDLSALGRGDPRARWGTDITVFRDGRALRFLSVHLKAGCWGRRQDRNAGRRETCASLRDQVRVLRAWIAARLAAGEAFVVLGDFNRRLAVPGDWAWTMLSSSRAPLRLLAAGRSSRCDPRFVEFIDHIVLGGGAGTMLVPGSFREHPRQGAHPDHCALSLRLSLR